MRGKGFFGQTRRERRAYPAVDLEGASNEVWPKKNCRPEGCAEFGLWRRCSSVTDPLRGMRPPRALPQAKLGATHVSIIKCHTTRIDRKMSLRISSPPRFRRGLGMAVHVLLTTLAGRKSFAQY